MMDLIKSTYYWDFSSRHYIKVKEENIPGVKIAEDQLGEIYRGTTEVFKKHITGPWFLSSDLPIFVGNSIPSKGVITFFFG